MPRLDCPSVSAETLTEQVEEYQEELNGRCPREQPVLAVVEAVNVGT